MEIKEKRHIELKEVHLRTSGERKHKALVHKSSLLYLIENNREGGGFTTEARKILI